MKQHKSMFYVLTLHLWNHFSFLFYHTLLHRKRNQWLGSDFTVKSSIKAKTLSVPAYIKKRGQQHRTGTV